MINIVMTFAQLERETIVERVTDNYYFRATNGYWAGGYAPFGYKIKHIIGHDNKKHSVLEIDEKEAPIVKQIYDMYINKNMSMRKIAQELNVQKIPTKKHSGLWGINAINSILSRPIYTKATSKIYNYYNNYNTHITNDIDFFDGSMTANLYGKTKKNIKVKALRDYSDMYLSLIKCMPLISNEDWFKAQKIKGERNYLPPRSNSSKISFLCGLVKCGNCGSNMVTQGCKNKQGKQYYYLICTKKRNLGSSVCNNKMIDVSKLQEIVVNDIKTYFNSKDINKKIKTYISQTKKKDAQKIIEKENVENEILKLNIQIQNLIDSLAEGNTTISKYINQKIEEIEKQKQELTTKLKTLSHNDTQNNDIIEFIKNINEKLVKFSHSQSTICIIWHWLIFSSVICFHSICIIIKNYYLCHKK